MRILLCGADGRMGKAVTELAHQRGDTIVCGLSLVQDLSGPFPVYNSFDAVPQAADVLRDVSSPALLDALLEHATRHALPVVIASTGLDAEAVARIEAAAQCIPILRASNMSLGVAVLRRLVRMAQQAQPGFDIAITDKHHHMKKDAPSGTALTLLEDLQQHNPALHKVPGRDGQVGARTQNEVGMHAVRGGTVVGEHTVSFYGEDETVEITHIAQSRRIFAAGALAACHALAGRKPGLYTLDDVLFGENA